jgi:hypothetical protein
MRVLIAQSFVTFAFSKRKVLGLRPGFARLNPLALVDSPVSPDSLVQVVLAKLYNALVLAEVFLAVLSIPWQDVESISRWR